MIPSKAYIIRTRNELSQQYAADCARSCADVGLPFEFFEGVEGKSSYDAWVNSGLDIKPGSMDHRIDSKSVDPAACCSVSHALVWRKIVENDECAIIMEHDAIMLHPINIDISEDKITVLGYKLKHPSDYNHIKAGPPNKIVDIRYHHGAHAYALTPSVAKMLLKEMKDIGGGGPIDNRFFLRERWSKVPLCMLLPTPAVGWIRETTIWNKPNYEVGVLLPDFEMFLKRNHYK